MGDNQKGNQRDNPKDNSHLLVPHGYDTILMADVVYEPEHYLSLVDSMRSLCHSKSIILHAHRKRHADERFFFAEVERRGFLMEEIEIEREREICTDRKLVDGE